MGTSKCYITIGLYDCMCNHVELHDTIVLSKSFGIGEYDTTIFVQPYKMDGVTPTNNANMNTKLIVR